MIGVQDVFGRERNVEPPMECLNARLGTVGPIVDAKTVKMVLASLDVALTIQPTPLLIILGLVFVMQPNGLARAKGERTLECLKSSVLMHTVGSLMIRPVRINARVQITSSLSIKNTGGDGCPLGKLLVLLILEIKEL